MHKKLFIILGNNDGETFQLEYDIISSESAQLWADRLKKSKDFGLCENKRFYNFPGHKNSNSLHLQSDLEKIILELKGIHPNMDFPCQGGRDLQVYINDLHKNFAHSHLVERLINSENERQWAHFNVLLHALESQMRSERSVERNNLPHARIVFTWNKNHKILLENKMYSDFTLEYQFGTAYANYPQTGRQLWEMYVSGDDQLEDEHIRPQKFISGNTHLWFGPSTRPGDGEIFVEKLGNWFEQRKERFNRLGLYWGDPKLALGRIPVAKLSTQMTEISLTRAFLKSLGQFEFVKEVEIQ
jgi:hypothetical protein